MKYFLHDSNSFNDEKVTELYLEFGYEGLGLFYTILEKLAYQEKPIKTNVLKHQLNVGKKLEKCWRFMEEIDLISSNNGETFNKQLLNFSEKYQVKKEKNAKRILQWRENQAVRENVTDSENVRNACKEKKSKVNKSKESKVKEISAAPVVLSFRDELWNRWFSYKKEKRQSYTPSGRETLLAKFESKSDFELQQIIEQSIANNWSGLFPLKQPMQEINKTPTKGKMQTAYENISQAGNNIIEQIENGTFVNPFSGK